MLNAERFGLGLNIRHFMKLTDWNQLQVAQLMHPYITENVSIKQLRHSLGGVVNRKQRRWKYSVAFALAFGLPEQALLVEDLRHYGSLPAFQRHYNFNRQEVIRRSAAQVAKRETPEQKQFYLKYLDDLREAAGTLEATRLNQKSQ
jgi:ribosomal protein S19E (S16A)